ncbi:PLC-like phosphodiesterase [Lactarius akahatsu]|uniref:Phosphoinositide phospholipase C n=1 Tax=Lactarius akahatsu TaxID=416441 RepID=A0AAD4LN62_9AGAM|nr:PLC-like phosphodiesterase [Lactarius akahatsu]
MPSSAMVHSNETDGPPSPTVSPLRRAMNMLTSHGQPSPELRGIMLSDENAVDMEEESPSSTPFLSPQPSPSPSRLSLRRNTGSGSGGGSSPLASLRRMRDATVSLVRSKSSGERSPAGRPIRQRKSEKTRHGRSLSDAIPATSRPAASQAAPVTVKSSITTQSPSRAPSISPRRATVPLPALNFQLESLPLPPMSLSLLPPVLDEDHPPAAPVAQPASILDLTVPDLLQKGTPMIKVSGRKQTDVVFRLDPDQGQIIWESKKHRIIPIENIKELRTASDARYYRELFQIPQECENRWLTIIYTLDGRYKIWHVIAPSVDVFEMWDSTLRKLYAVRQALMCGLGNIDLREAVWEKQYWKASDEQADQKLYMEDVEKLCRRLNVNPSHEDLDRRFRARVQADVQKRGFLDFTDFKRFVKSLKARPEVERRYKKLCSLDNGSFSYRTFDHFMRIHQKSTAPAEELQRLFLRYATSSPDDIAPHAIQLPTDVFLNGRPDKASPAAKKPSPENLAAATLSLEGFTAFLLSTDNSAFTDQDGSIHHDMTRPLSEYYISSSHNTYLVGHQLVGDSTIEGYIRALLHSCRSVELDIYDGDKEPVVYHGKTLTTKVSLREVCEAIMKYAFVVSPYPVIISAEVHCSIPQQDTMASIMHEVFGESLVSAPVNGRPKIDVLPSPEDLKGRVLLKAKNLYVSESEEIQPNVFVVEAESSTTSTTETSTDGEVISELKHDWVRVARGFSEAKQEVSKARNVLRRRSPSNAAPQTDKGKARMSLSVVSMLVYTVGVKCRGINKKEQYAPVHVFSLSENTANKMFKRDGMLDLVKHNRTHVVRVYPKGTRVSSSNYQPHRYWSAGVQLSRSQLANLCTHEMVDLGFVINHAMFQRNGRSGYVLRPPALRSHDKSLLNKRTRHYLDITVISAQQLPLPKDAHGREIIDKSALDPYVEVSLHLPDWSLYSSPPTSSSPQQVSCRTSGVKNNGFNPVWEEALSLPFEVVGDMRELVFVRFAVRQDGDDEREALAVHCVSLACLREGFRHLPLHDAQISQYLFSTLFVQINIRDATT